MLVLYTQEQAIQAKLDGRIDPKAAELARRILVGIEDAYGQRAEPEKEDGGKVIVVQYITDLSEAGLDTAEGVLSEGPVICIDGYFDVVRLANNDYSVTYLIPDAPWLPPEVRQSLLDQRP